MIEIHSHVCFGIDDGPSDLATARHLLTAYARQGVHTVIATPHLEPQHYQSPARLQIWLDQRQVALAALQAQPFPASQPPAPPAPPIALHPGCELALSPDCLPLLRNEQLARQLTLANSGYLLVELPRFLSGGIKVLDKLLFSIQLAGYTPILAHPERAMMDDSVLPTLQDWIDRDRLLLQINTSSLVEDPSLSAEQQARYSKRRTHVRTLMSAGLVHFVASDAHHPEQRPPQNQLAWRTIEQAYGQPTAQRLLLDNPRRILLDQPIV